MISLQTRLKLRFFAYTLVCFVIGFLTGFSWRAIHHKCQTQKATQTKDVAVESKIETKTIVRYVEKESPTDADVDVTIPKQTLTVKVNGKEQTFQKSDNEKYVLDKNKIALEQSSKASIDIKVPVIDNTRRWELGVGVDKHGQPAGMVGFPIKGNVGGWVAGSKSTVMGGVKVHF
ncbi:hypothetical protein [Acidaminococcus intestini]|jgi:hypothetical protein|uniref:hypothetical protein n=1 Tax=Acidaminococcus intestini TaxID=187327 RepID=UPI003A844685